MNRKYATLSHLALLCSAAVMVPSAFAAVDAIQDSVNVNYVVADLASPEGAERVYRRIQLAARQVCHEPTIRDLQRYRAYLRCYNHAVDAAVAKVDSTALTALHRNKTHGAAG